MSFDIGNKKHQHAEYFCDTSKVAINKFENTTPINL